MEQYRRTVAALPSDVMNVTLTYYRALAEQFLMGIGCLLSEYEPWKVRSGISSLTEM